MDAKAAERSIPTSSSHFTAMFKTVASGAVVAYAALALANRKVSVSPDTIALPPQAVFIDPRSFAVMGPNATFRQDALDNNTFFNPTGSTPPFFQVFNEAFLNILGPEAIIRQVAVNDTFAFAHEAPIFNEATNELFFASNDGGALGMSDLNHNNLYGKISMQDVSAAFAANESDINVPVTELNLPDTIQMTNGGTGPYNNSLLLITSGRGPLPPSIALVNPLSPNNATVLLDNYFGRQFNSLNDIKIHPTNGKIFFTDTIYGFLNQFRPPPLMPSQVYRFDPDTGAVKIVADGFDKCNGIAFSSDGKLAYITDTGVVNGVFGNNQTEPASIYVFDVDPVSHAFKNRRVLAYVDAGVPDGIQLDTDGNIYSGTGDGVQVWNPDGVLLGKFFLGTTSANMVFAGPGTLAILAETKIFVAKIAATGFSLGGPQ
ncbi:calcium-dependent phosphotriesterase [Dendrothele bispora CBS 962.96]|uniref:Calcium-dependent phosphotriesterase n=1 Tax=Dendrothele bispora (strain CBS 962.96) TaxID=1314807 RepID=A0A4S8L8T6_DENBC|nr:calcium-dependent phosphotriesterase [Dendrothele bispora CBS 962.96]